MREKGRKIKRMKERKKKCYFVYLREKEIPFENFVSKIVVLSGMCRSFRFTKGEKERERNMIMVRKSARKRDETFVNPKKNCTCAKLLLIII